jgi:hypothetical protein
MSATIGAINGNSKSEVECGPEYGKVVDWAKEETYDALRKHECYKQWQEEIKIGQCVSTLEVEAYRGRPFDERIKSWKKMGPPPKNKGCKSGRYNDVNEKVLYLCDSKDGVCNELKKENREIFIQRYLIVNKGMKILHLADYPIQSFVQAVIWNCEFAGTMGYPDQTFSRFIAQTIRKAGFDGFKVRGVQALNSEPYFNYVLLNPYPRWVDWVDKKWIPESLKL